MPPSRPDNVQGPLLGLGEHPVFLLEGTWLISPRGRPYRLRPWERWAATAPTVPEMSNEHESLLDRLKSCFLLALIIGGFLLSALLALSVPYAITVLFTGREAVWVHVTFGSVAAVLGLAAFLAMLVMPIQYLRTSMKRRVVRKFKSKCKAHGLRVETLLPLLECQDPTLRRTALACLSRAGH